VYVASNNSSFTQGQIIVISVATHEVISQFAAGSQALGLAISPDGQTLYSCDDNSDIQVISTASQTITATINLNVPVITGFAPILALSPDGTSLWVATFSSAIQAIYVINTATDQVASTTIPLWASSLAFTPDGAEIYAAYYGYPNVPHSSALALIDASSLAVIDPTVGGKAMYAQHTTGPNKIAISPDGKELYISENYRPAHRLLSTVVRALDTSDATSIRDIHSTDRPEYINGLAVTPSGKYLYLGVNRRDATIDAYLTSIDATARNVTGGKAHFHGYPIKLAITPNANFIYVVATERTGSNVTVVDISPE
jgi:DNA-binding beta-propeller fold protein YncE